MKKAILATKVGMTQIFNEDGVLVPVTVLEAGPCVVTQIKTEENDGYKAEYLKEMSFAPHIGFFSYGEHYENQFINQTMSCAVFE